MHQCNDDYFHIYLQILWLEHFNICPMQQKDSYVKNSEYEFIHLYYTSFIL